MSFEKVFKDSFQSHTTEMKILKGGYVVRKRFWIENIAGKGNSKTIFLDS